MYYFAYGSNLDVSQMTDRCPEAEPVGTALLRDHTLAFGGHSPNWEGAPATVVPDEEADVPGLVYEVSYDEIRVLDHYEGHPVRYERRLESVFHRDEGTTRKAQIYIKEVDGPLGHPPASYLSVLKEAYETLGFDLEILERALALGSEARNAAREGDPQPAAVGSD
ncbi:MAG: gamma-glutamylcyclotransferase family protein [Bradymonadaceae bacterium]